MQYQEGENLYKDNNIILTVKNLTKRFGKRIAVNSISFSILKGQCLAILGPNGAGKTTTIHMLVGVVEKTSGTIEIFNHFVPDDLKKIKKKVGVVPQVDNLDPDLTVIENLVIYASYFNIKKKIALERAYELLHFFALYKRKNEVISNLSGGQRRRIILARALINKPELLILDEPTIGLDPQARLLIWERLERLKARGTTMLLTSHYMEEVSRLSDNLIILNRGKIIVQGNAEKLIEEIIGPEVFELELSSEIKIENLLEKFSQCDIAVDRSPQRLYIYPKDNKRAKVVEKIIKEFPKWIRRPSNLEDVFLRLTGRKLRDQ